jgi:hypothetical protein
VCQAAIGAIIATAHFQASKKMTATLTKTLKPTSPLVVDDPRWARVVARVKTADGHLWYSVSTTGVYCRPSCPSRIANPKNVQLHDTLESARATGFRPCRRCNPDGSSMEAEHAALDQPAFNRDRLKAEKLIDSKVLEQRIRVQLDAGGSSRQSVPDHRGERGRALA